ncbi:MAG TPA: hypothetical protein VMV46_00735 [Thermoanaerobaculia bacterium]|nr:hypothetical protein [Thermoanaerobaculia bacterium]
MLSRSLLAVLASALAATAGLVAQLDGDLDIVPFFVGLTVLGSVGAFVVREPYTDNRRVFGAMLATVWIAAAVIIGGLLLWHQALCGCSMPEPTAEATYLGLTATVYHVAGVYLGGALMAVAAFSRALAR